jgi:poly-gamma-glutamate synthase PgsB/CapB
MLSAFGSTIPRGKILFTAETRHTRPLSDEASRRGAEFVLASAESVDDATMARFAYHEHKDNVALALAVCRHLGVSRDVALDGMVGAQPDPGALTSIALRQGAKELVLVNAMAANDPQSTYQLYRELVEDESAGDRRVILANARRDRPGRTQQLADLLPRLTADQVFAIGDAAGELREMAIQRGLPRAQIATHGGSAEDLVTRLFGHPGRSSVVFAIGNIAGPGLALTNYFESNGRPTRAARMRPVVTLRAA